MTIPFPDDEYVQLIGRVAYAVTYLEGMVLFDLPRHEAVLPPQRSADKLGGKSTGAIAGAITAHVAQVTDPAVARFLTAAASALAAAARRRNSMLHARPATIDGVQMLYRQRRATENSPAEEVAITVEWLTDVFAEIERLRADLEPLRV